MKIKDVRRMFDSYDDEQEIIIGWWAEIEEIPEEDWDNFVNFADTKKDWSDDYEAFLYMYEEWKREQPVDNTKEPLYCPTCKADLGEVDVHYTMVETDHNVAWREVTCGECDSTWKEHYTFDCFIMEEK